MPKTTQSAVLSSHAGKLVRLRRQTLKLTQAELGERLDVSAAYVQKIEAGRCNLTLGQLERVLDALAAYLAIAVLPLADEPVGVPVDEVSQTAQYPLGV